MNTHELEKEFVAPERQSGEFQKLRTFLSSAAVTETSTCHLVGADGREVELPEELFDILRHAANILGAGRRVHICPVEKEITTQEAADLLNISRPYLIKMLDAGKIRYSKIGRHRRIRFGDVVQYKHDRNAERARELEALIGEARENGLYDSEYTPQEGEI